jgi:hypothetical protein
MGHEAVRGQISTSSTWLKGPAVDILGDTLQHRSGLEDEGRQDDTTQVCAGSQLRDDVRQHWTGRVSFALSVGGISRTISLVGLDDLVFPAWRGILHRGSTWLGVSRHGLWFDVC